MIVTISGRLELHGRYPCLFLVQLLSDHLRQVDANLVVEELSGLADVLGPIVLRHAEQLVPVDALLLETGQVDGTGLRQQTDGTRYSHIFAVDAPANPLEDSNVVTEAGPEETASS